MSEDKSTNDSDLNEKIEIFSTEDEKIKSFGELLTNDSSRAILQWLLTNEMTAKQIAEKIEVSLPLVIYHLNKMQELGVVKISKVGKNVKERDMKYYTATKFAIIILPASVSEKAKKSKMLLRSIKSIYRFAGIAIAGVATWFGSTSMQSAKFTLSEKIIDSSQGSLREGRSLEESTSSFSESSSPFLGNVEEGGQTGARTLEETLELSRRTIEAAEANPAAGSGIGFIEADLFWPIVITIAVVGIGLSLEMFYRIYLHSKKKQKAKA